MEDYDETRAATDTSDAQVTAATTLMACAASPSPPSSPSTRSMSYDAGFCGVDVFFAISGFVVAASLKGRERTSTKTFLVEFYARRAKRLAPALFLTILATAIGLRLVPLHERDARIAYDAALCALGGASNIFFAVLFTNEKNEKRGARPRSRRATSRRGPGTKTRSSSMMPRRTRSCTRGR